MESMLNTIEQWFTSDLHFGHKNIIKYCERPTTEEEMTEWLIARLNSFIKPDDDVYHMGDLTLKMKNKKYIKDILSRLNGNWKFILGNHDDEKTLREVCEELGKHEVLGWYHVAKFHNRKFVMHHFPHRSWQDSRHGSIDVHGHTHGGLLGKELPNQIDVGLDATPDFRPLRAIDVIQIVESRNPNKDNVDHHAGQLTGGY